MCKIMRTHHILITKQGFEKWVREQEIHKRKPNQPQIPLEIDEVAKQIQCSNKWFNTYETTLNMDTKREPTCWCETRKINSRNLCGNRCPPRHAKAKSPYLWGVSSGMNPGAGEPTEGEQRHSHSLASLVGSADNICIIYIYIKILYMLWGTQLTDDNKCVRSHRSASTHSGTGETNTLNINFVRVTNNRSLGIRSLRCYANCFETARRNVDKLPFFVMW